MFVRLEKGQRARVWFEEPPPPGSAVRPSLWDRVTAAQTAEGGCSAVCAGAVEVPWSGPGTEAAALTGLDMGEAGPKDRCHSGVFWIHVLSVKCGSPARLLSSTEPGACTARGPHRAPPPGDVGSDCPLETWQGTWSPKNRHRDRLGFGSCTCRGLPPTPPPLHCRRNPGSRLEESWFLFPRLWTRETAA